MHQIVTDLQFLQFFHGEGHLTRTRSIALQIVLMEAVEDLMVGKETCAKVIVYESFVQSTVNRNKNLPTLFFVRENLVQTLMLLRAVGKNI